MKNIKQIIVVTLLLATQCLKAQSIQIEYKNKGAIYQLTIWKYAMESVMSRILNDSTGHEYCINLIDTQKLYRGLNNRDDKKKKYLFDSVVKDIKNQSIANYSVIQAELDASIAQFIYELNRRNRIFKRFDKINNYFKKGPKSKFKCYDARITQFNNELFDYIKDCKTFIEIYVPKKHSSLPTAAGVADIDPVAVIDQIWTIFKDLKDIQAKKIDSLIEMFEKIRLKNSEELIKHN